MDKIFRLAPADLRSVADGRGQCIATSRITVEGQQVGHMVREQPAFVDDSGWRFTAGTETEAYGQNPDNWDVVDVNLVANLDPEIVPFLDGEIGAALVRWPMGAPLRPVSDVAAGAPAAVADGDTPAGPMERQRQALSRDWWIDLPGPFTGFLSDGALQLVSVEAPPRRVWVDIRNAADGGRAGVAARMIADIREAARPSGAVEYSEPGSDPDEHRIAYWYEEGREGVTASWTLYAYTIRDASFVQAAFLASTPDPEWALAAWRSLRYVPGSGRDWEPPTPDDQ